MHHHYADITSRIPEPPKWWDEEAVPRYCDFSPRETANIYADEVALVEITCQSCGTEFHVAFSRHRLAAAFGGDKGTLAERVRDRTLHYGDPPNAGCCCSGPTMNSEPRRVLEFWHREGFDWQRVPALEVEIEPDWVTPQAERRFFITHRRLSWSELRIVPKVVVCWLAVDAWLHAVLVAAYPKPGLPLWQIALVVATLLAIPVLFLEFALHFYGTDIHFGEPTP